MELYIFTFFVLFISCAFNLFLERNGRKKFLLVIPFVVLTYQMGFRWEMGTDWIIYKENYETTTEIRTALINIPLGFEPSYGMLAVIINKFTGNYTVFLLINSFIYYALIFKASTHLSPYPVLSIALLYSLTIGILGSNRQLLAIAICIYSLKFIYSRENKKFFAGIFIAATFHMSALLFSIYFILNRRFNFLTISAAIVTSIIIGMSSIPSAIFGAAGDLFGGIIGFKATYYADNSNLAATQLSIAGLIKRLIVFCVVSFIYTKISVKHSSYTILFNGYCTGLIIYFLFHQSLLILVNRGSIYFTITEAFLLSYLPAICKTKIDRYIAIALLSIYSIILFFQSIAAYPDLFIPYQDTFFTDTYHRSLR